MKNYVLHWYFDPEDLGPIVYLSNEDLHQDKNEGFDFACASIEHFLEGSTYSVKTLVS